MKQNEKIPQWVIYEEEEASQLHDLLYITPMFVLKDFCSKMGWTQFQEEYKFTTKEEISVEILDLLQYTGIQASDSYLYLKAIKYSQ